MNNSTSKINKTIVIIFTICLVLITVFSIVFPLTYSLGFYEYSFLKNNTAELTGYNDKQLSRIALHIIRFLKGEAISFHYEIDNLNVFSNQAIIHMKDVRDLFFLLQNAMFFIFILFLALIVYIYVKRQQFKDIMFKYSSITIMVIIGILLIFGIIAIIDFDFAFTLFHRIIFFDETKFNDSFFGRQSNYSELDGVENRMLVWILSERFFIDFAIIVIAITVFVIIVYLLLMYLYKKKGNRQKISE